MDHFSVSAAASFRAHIEALCEDSERVKAQAEALRRQSRVVVRRLRQGGRRAERARRALAASRER